MGWNDSDRNICWPENSTLFANILSAVKPANCVYIYKYARFAYMPLRRCMIYWNVFLLTTKTQASSWLHFMSLRWRRNGHGGVSNHQPHHCLLNRLFGCRSKKTSKLPSLAFVWRIHRRPVNSPYKWPVTQKMFPFDDVIMHTSHKAVWMHNGWWQIQFWPKQNGRHFADDILNVFASMKNLNSD